MFSRSLDLTGVLWKAEHSDGNIIQKGPQRYPQINRKKLEVFSLTFHNKPILEVHPSGRSLVARLKTVRKQNLTSSGELGEAQIYMRVWIIALLAKPKSEETKQICKVDLGGDKFQTYEIDKEDSRIYYVYENGKQEIRNHFGVMSPYLALHLRDDELEYLTGKDE